MDCNGCIYKDTDQKVFTCAVSELKEAMNEFMNELPLLNKLYEPYECKHYKTIDEM